MQGATNTRSSGKFLQAFSKIEAHINHAHADWSSHSSAHFCCTILMKQPCLRGSYFRLIDHSLTKPKRKWRVLETVFTDVPCIPTEPEANPFGKVPLARQSYLYTSSIYHTDCTSNSNRAPTPTKGFVAWGGCSVFELWALCRVQPT